jgi:beta-lactamase regulating signal transducer with metallopeptidase domain
MITALLILLKFSLTIMVIWVFYKLLLEKLTFFVSNRFFFLGSISAAFFVAVCQFDWINTLFQTQINNADLRQYVPSTNGQFFSHTPLFFQAGRILLVIYAIGVILLAGNQLIQYLSYLKLKRGARIDEINNQKVFIVSRDILPFSFGNAVFIPENASGNPEINKILLHEAVHIRQNHTIDVLLAELVKIINWINPFAWLLKKAVGENLEFLTDACLINQGVDKKSYQYLLLHFSGNNPFSLVTNFNFYSLKTRISKMNQNQSNRLQYGRFLLFAPSVLMLMFVFSCMNEQTTDVEPKSKKLGKDAVIELKSDLNNRVGKLNLLSKTVPDNNQSLLLKKTALNDAIYELKLDEKSPAKQTLSLKKAENPDLLPPPPPPAPRR